MHLTQYTFFKQVVLLNFIDIGKSLLSFFQNATFLKINLLSSCLFMHYFFEHFKHISHEKVCGFVKINKNRCMKFFNKTKQYFIRYEMFKHFLYTSLFFCYFNQFIFLLLIAFLKRNLKYHYKNFPISLQKICMFIYAKTCRNNLECYIVK